MDWVLENNKINKEKTMVLISIENTRLYMMSKAKCLAKFKVETLSHFNTNLVHFNREQNCTASGNSLRFLEYLPRRDLKVPKLSLKLFSTVNSVTVKHALTGTLGILTHK